MITELTETQKSKLPEYVDKWVKIGLNTEPANRVEAEKGIELAYKIAGLKKPKIVWTLSPLSSGITRYCVFGILKNITNSVGDSMVNSVGDSVRDSVRDSVGDSMVNSVGNSMVNSVRDSVGDSVWNSVWDSVWNSVRDSVRISVGDSVANSVRDSVRISVGNSVWNSVWDSVRISVRDSVRISVGDSVANSVRDSVGDSVYGQHDASWLGFYDYFYNELNLKSQTKKLNGLWLIAKNANWFLPHKNICWISERHDICKLKDGKIHSINSPAIHYLDGFEIYALNGVRLPKEIVMTPAEKIDPKIILTEKNAEIRRELVRKIGIERVIYKLGAKSLDKSGDGIYELLSINLGDERYRPYLKMRNPSIQTWHIEGVAPNIRTVEEALKWRNQSEEKPIQLT